MGRVDEAQNLFLTSSLRPFEDVPFLVPCTRTQCSIVFRRVQVRTDTQTYCEIGLRYTRVVKHIVTRTDLCRTPKM